MCRILFLFTVFAFAASSADQVLAAPPNPRPTLYLISLDDFDPAVTKQIAVELDSALPFEAVVIAKPWQSSASLLEDGWHKYLENVAATLLPSKRTEVLAKVGITEAAIQAKDYAALEKLFLFVQNYPGGTPPGRLLDFLKNRSLDIQTVISRIKIDFAERFLEPNFGAVVVFTKLNLRATTPGYGGYTDKLGWGEIGSRISIVSSWAQDYAEIFPKVPDVQGLAALSVASIGWGFNLSSCDNRFEKTRDSWRKEYEFLLGQPKQPTAACNAGLRKPFEKP